MWILASVLLLSASFSSQAWKSEANEIRSTGTSNQDLHDAVADFVKDDWSGDSSHRIIEEFSFTSSQSLSGGEAEDPDSVLTSLKPGNDQEFIMTRQQDDVTSKTEPSDKELGTPANKSMIPYIREQEFTEKPDIIGPASGSITDLPKTDHQPPYGSLISEQRQSTGNSLQLLVANGRYGHRRWPGKIKEEEMTPDSGNIHTEISEDYYDDMDDDNDVNSIYTLAHFRHELYAYVNEQVSTTNSSVVELLSHLQHRISLLESQLTENVAYTSVLETKIRVSATPQHGDIRLLSSDSCGRVYRAGYLLFYTGITWGFVCDDFFNAAAVKVACTQLGYPQSISALESGPTMSPSGPDMQMKRRWQDSYQIVLDDVQCMGEESSIDSCGHFELGKHDCSIDEVVYLSC